MVRAAVFALAVTLLVACEDTPSMPDDAAIGIDLVRLGDATEVDVAQLDAATPDIIIQDVGPDALPSDVGDAPQVDAVQLEAATPDAIVRDAGPDAPPGDVGVDAALPRPSATSLLPCTRNADCDDGIACTDDFCGSRPDGTRQCAYRALPSMCGAAETCDIRMGCRPGHVCATNADCADTDPCTVGERCASESRVCVYDTVLDGDNDGYAPRACGGPDCDDGTAMIRPGVAERCNGTDDNCNGRTDEGSARDLCGEGASCASYYCVLDTPVVYADLVRVCTFQFACDGGLRWGFGSTRTVNDCVAYLASELPDPTLGVQIAEVTSGSGTTTTIEETGIDPIFLRAAIARAHTATTCADYFGPPGVTPPTCTVASHDYLRCDGDAIRMGCREPVPCRRGTHCQVNTMDTTMGSARIVRSTATCTPTATSVLLRCADGTMTDSRMPRCPMDSLLRCTAEAACDGSRLSLCVNSQRYDLDCATLRSGSTCSTREVEPRSGLCVRP